MRFKVSSKSARSSRILCFALLVWGARSSGADGWRGDLPDGTRVEVDSETRKAWRVDGSQRLPLWDGVHRLEDGSVVIVRDGTAVPSESMLQTWRQPAGEVSVPIGSPCDLLVQRTCGADYGCGQSEPCRLANELFDMAREELARGPGYRGRASSDDQCREAMDNDFFKPCP